MSFLSLEPRFDPQSSFYEANLKWTRRLVVPQIFVTQ